MPLLVADEKGFFTAENLEVEINFGGQSSTVCQALSSRSVDMGNCSINDLIQSVEIGGAPLALLMTESVTALNYAAIARAGAPRLERPPRQDGDGRLAPR